MTKSGKLDKRTRIGRALQPLIDDCKDLNENSNDVVVAKAKLETKVIQRTPPTSIMTPQPINVVKNDSSPKVVDKDLLDIKVQTIMFAK